MLHIFIDGFGRIGRSILRNCIDYSNFKNFTINDLNSDIHNICYQLNYDTTYGKLKKIFRVKNKNKLTNGIITIKVINTKTLTKNSLKDVDILIDSTGISRSKSYLNFLKKGKIKNIIFTNLQTKLNCKYILPGINHDELIKKTFSISAGTCDGNAIVPFLNIIKKKNKILFGDVTTLHPWLSYQNLLDGSANSVSDPNNIYSTYVLGRSVMNNIIPKSTSAVSVASKIIKKIDRKLSCMSFRVPTSIVSCAKISLVLSKSIDIKKLKKEIQQNYHQQNYNLIKTYNEPLTSIDFLNSKYSSNIDLRFLSVKGKLLNALLWYDNENGYTSRVLDILKILKNLYY